MKKSLLILVAASTSLLAGCSYNAEAPAATNVPDENKPVQETVIKDGRHPINASSSIIAWTGSNVVGKTHKGMVSLKEGYIDTVDSKLAGGSFVIDMATISDNDGSDMLVKHLSGQDFFDTASYPESKLVITSIEPDSGRPEYYLAKADLTIKNKTNQISFGITLEGEGKAIIAKTNFSIDRTLWDVRYGSGKFFQDLGDKMIKDEISYDISLITK